MNLSIGLITYNEEKDLARTLNAIKYIADEIVIVDNGSTDKTVEIAQSFNARVFTEPWKGFGPQKNSVIDKCKGDWILFLDADEEVTPALRELIREITTSQAALYDAYKIRFRSFCFGKEIKHGSLSGHYKTCLFRKNAGRFENKQVHENFITASAEGKIQEYINHYTYANLEEYFEKINSYSSKSAAECKERNEKKSTIATYLLAKFSFFKSYILRLGFLDGYEGYLLSKVGAMYIMIKYSKLRELNRQV
jgi:glycosyltransferase involved in cell wall biosynthesis